MTGVSSAAVTPAAGSFPVHFAAPYLQIASSDAGDMAADMKASGNKFYTLAFLIPKGSCTAQWEDNNDAVGAFTSQIKRALKSAGRQRNSSRSAAPRAASRPRSAHRCPVWSRIRERGQDHGVTRLDFDIEGSDLNNTTANARRDQALAALQKANPAVAGRLHPAGRPRTASSPTRRTC